MGNGSLSSALWDTPAALLQNHAHATLQLRTRGGFIHPCPYSHTSKLSQPKHVAWGEAPAASRQDLLMRQGEGRDLAIPLQEPSMALTAQRRLSPTLSRPLRAVGVSEHLLPPTLIKRLAVTAIPALLCISLSVLHQTLNGK